MSRQIDALGNTEDIWLFYRYLPEGTDLPENYDDVPLAALLPAFMLSELKTAFQIGFMLFLPFLVIDLVVASVLMWLFWLMVRINVPQFGTTWAQKIGQAVPGSASREPLATRRTPTPPRASTISSRLSLRPPGRKKT